MQLDIFKLIEQKNEEKNIAKPQTLFIVPSIDSQYNATPAIKNYIRNLYNKNTHDIAIIFYKDYQIESFSTASLRFNPNTSLDDIEQLFLKASYSSSNKISEGKGCLETAFYEALQINWDKTAKKDLIFFSQKNPNTPNAPLNERNICAKTCIQLLIEKDIYIMGVSILEHNASLFNLKGVNHIPLYNIHKDINLLENYKVEYFEENGKKSISKFQTLHLEKDVNIQSFLDATNFQCKRKIHIEQKNLKKFKKDRIYIGKKENVFSYVFSIEQYKEGNYDKIYETNQKNTTLKHDSEVLYIPLFS